MAGIFASCVSGFFGLLAMAWPELGTAPSGEHIKKIAESPNYDKKTERFVNRNQVEYDKAMQGFDYSAMLKKQVFGKEVRAPSEQLPQEKPDLERFLASSSLTYHWLGHSTILLRLDQKTLLIDPVFTNAAPIPWAVKRFQAPVLPLNELPTIDLILISHDHYDHLDRESILHFVDTETKFIVPLGLSSHLIGWGISEDRITELDWWDEFSFAELQIACTPSQHFSGRLGPRGNTTLWASWVVVGVEERFYFSGDSGYDAHFQAIGDKYGPFDVAFIESGQYNPIWPMTHMFPEESVQASSDLSAKKVQPIHWGMFVLSTHDWFDPVSRMLEGSKEKNFKLMTPIIGEEVIVEEDQTFPLWWTK